MTTLQQLLWLEIILKGGTGLALLVMPKAVTRVLGLPPFGSPFWPRALGSVLLGAAIAILLGAWLARSNGLGLAGAATINVAAAVLIISELTVGAPGLARRGRWFLWLLVAVLLGVSLVEIAWI
jgi:hypothetical protein